MRRAGLMALVGVLLLLLVAGAALARPVDSQTQAFRTSLLADLTCARGGGANVTFTVRNLGNRPIRIKDDFHLVLEKVEPGGRELVGAVFVFPVPEFALIAPGSASTFVVPIGTKDPGQTGVNLRNARRLLLEAEVFFKGREQPVRRQFSFAGCGS